MLSALLGLAGLAGSLGGKFFDWMQARTNNQTTVDVAALQAASAVSHDEFAWPETRWMIAATIAVFLFHVGAVVSDSVFHTGHVTHALPPPMDTWEGTVLLAPFAAAGVLGVVKRIFGK